MTSTLTPVRKRSALTKGQLPKYAPYVVLALALVAGAAILALVGFNAFGWGIVSAILFAAGLVLFVITLAVNMIARWIITRHKEFSGAN
jgi:phosphate transport system permease protein